MHLLLLLLVDTDAILLYSHSDGKNGSKSTVPTSTLVGSIVAGVVVIVVLVIGAFLLIRHRRHLRGIDRIQQGGRSKENILPGPEVTTEPFLYSGAIGAMNCVSQVDVTEGTSFDPYVMVPPVSAQLTPSAPSSTASDVKYVDLSKAFSDTG